MHVVLFVRDLREKAVQPLPQSGAFMSALFPVALLAFVLDTFCLAFQISSPRPPPPCRSTPVPDPSTVMRMVLGWKVTAPAGWSCPHCAVSPRSGNCSLLPLFPLGPGEVKDTPGPLLLFLALSTLGYPLRLPTPLEIVSFISLSSYYPD